MAVSRHAELDGCEVFVLSHPCTPCHAVPTHARTLRTCPPPTHLCAGDLHMYGKAGVHFYTQQKTVTTKWPAEDVPTGPAAACASSPPKAPGNTRVPGLDRVGA